MDSLSQSNFGLLIAYVIPGGGFLFCLRSVSATVDHWFGAVANESPTVAGFLYVTLASVAVGLLLSTVRWLILDSVHHATGITRPELSWERMETTTPAFQLIVEHKYRYYQFYGNSLFAVLLSVPVLCVEFPLSWEEWGSLIVVILLLYLGSRDTLRSYYLESLRLLGGEPSSKPAAASKSDTVIP